MRELITVKLKTILAMKNILGQPELEVALAEGSTVRDLLAWMVNRWGQELSEQLFQPGTDLPLPHLRFMVNGRAIQFLNGLETVLKEGDEFMMLPMVAGG